MPSPSTSSTESTISLPTTADQEGRVAVANAQVYDIVRDVMRGELMPIQTQLSKITNAVEMQGGNIESLTEMLGDLGERMKGVETKETATQKRLAQLREDFQQRLRSELSQEEYQDASADAYDPAHPSDSLARQHGPGLESPATGRQT